MIEHRYPSGSRIYDLVCSTGNLAMALCDRMPAGSFEIVAVDSSRPMLEISRTRLQTGDRSADITHLCADIRQVDMDRAELVVVNFSLQFIPPADRDALLKKIHAALVPGGILLFSEKTIHPNQPLADLQVDFHYRFKREQGYSELEISQKREALENVLVPETVEAHQDRLRRCGFTAGDLWLKWFNFCSWIGMR